MLVVGSIHTVIYVTTACRYIHGDMEFMLENLCYGMWSLLVYIYICIFNLLLLPNLVYYGYCCLSLGNFHFF